MDQNLADVLRLGVTALGTNNNRPGYRPAAPEVSNKVHKDAWAPGVELHDYTDREPSEDGTYVKVVTHKERIELIEQPPTPEEVAEAKEQRKHSAIIGGIVAVGLVGVAGILQVLDRRQVRGQVKAKAQTTSGS